MTSGRNVTLIFVVTVLVIGAVMTAGCRERSELGDAPGSETVLPPDDSDEETTGDETTGDETPQDPETDDPDEQTPAPAISDSELAALAAELAAMESELDALVFPDDDFSDIEELLD